MRNARDIFLTLLVTIALLAMAACGSDPDTDDNPNQNNGDHQTAYEIWALDQGTDLGYIYDDQWSLMETIDLHEHGVTTPHMISFSSDGDYAVIASTASGNTTVIRTEDREIIEVIETGPRTHMASFTPDDSAILVAVIGSPDDYRDGEMVEIEADLSAESFSVGRTLTVADDPFLVDHSADFEDTGPICHEYGPDGTLAFITLGPGLSDGGLVVLDLETFELETAFGPEELPVNCGTVPTQDRSQLVLTGGSGESGEWFVLDTETFDIVDEGDSEGFDAHGVWLTPDGSEFWIVNRVSDDGIVLDASTFEIIDTFDDLGGTPDILAMDPAGDYVFVSLRGPNPVSAAHVAEGPTPGFSVLDASTRELVEVIEPDPDNEDSDFHGIGVRAVHH